MKATRITATLSAASLLIASIGSALAQVDDAGAHRLGDHPAVVVQRLHKTAGYDYAAMFYPHPAWLYLLAAPPRDGVELAAATTGTSRARPKAAAAPSVKLAGAGDGD
jgi:hypothetical protein